MKLDYLGAGRQNFLINAFGQCEGKGITNYTLIALYSEDAVCSLGSYQAQLTDYLTIYQQNGQKGFNVLISLASSVYPAGGEIHFKKV